jgi:hypothetical protein
MTRREPLAGFAALATRAAYSKRQTALQVILSPLESIPAEKCHSAILDRNGAMPVG